MIDEAGIYVMAETNLESSWRLAKNGRRGAFCEYARES